MVCSLCHGRGNLVNFQSQKTSIEFYTCPSCRGLGLRYDVTNNRHLQKIQQKWLKAESAREGSGCEI